MATYYVATTGNDSNNGSSGSPWRTFARANSTTATPRVQSGDTVIIKNGVYTERLIIGINGTTWQAETKWGAIIDGGWYPNMPTGSWSDLRDEFPTGAVFNGLVSISNRSDVTVDGLYVRHHKGRGFSIDQSAGNTSNNITIKNCWSDFTGNQGIQTISQSRVIVDRLTNLKLLNNLITRTSLKVHRDSGTGTSWGSSIGIAGTGALVKGNTVAWTFGEALLCYTGATNVTIEDNVAFATRDAVLIEHNRNVVVRNNLFCNLDTSGGGYIVGGNAVTFRGEAWPDNDWQNDNIQVYNNLIIGRGTAFTFGGIHSRASDVFYNNPTRIYIGHNTVIAGPNSNRVFYINASAQAYPRSGIVENNIFDTRRNTSTSDYLAGSQALTWRNNVWSYNVRSEFRGIESLIGTNPQLANATASVQQAFLPPSLANPSGSSAYFTSVVLPVNYIPLAGSVSRDRGNTSTATTNSTIPPAQARQRDFYNNQRSSPPDVGAIEYTGAIPTDRVLALFTASPTQGNVPLTVNFTDGSTASGAAVINSRYWQFGDGTTSTATNPSKTYNTPGSYTVRLTVADTTRPAVVPSTYELVIQVNSGASPSVTASFTQKNSAGQPATGGQLPYTVSFDGSASTAENGATVREYRWRFFSTTGVDLITTTPTTSYAYLTEGTYTPQLRVRDTVLDVYSDWVSGTPIVVTAASSGTPVIVPSFTQTVGGDPVTEGYARLTVDFTDTTTASNATPDSWLWNFGDGNTSTAQNPTHTFTTAGIYRVQLTVGDSSKNVYQTFTGPELIVRVAAAGDYWGVDAVRVAAPTSTGDMEFTFAFTPTLVLFWLSGATATATNTAHARHGFGAATATQQFALAGYSTDAVGTTVNKNIIFDDAALVAINGSGTTGKARFKSITTNKMTLDVTEGFGAAYLVTALAFTEPAARHVLEVINPGEVGAITTLGGDESLKLLIGASFGHALGRATLSAANRMMLGFSDTETTLSVAWSDRDALTTTGTDIIVNTLGQIVGPPFLGKLVIDNATARTIRVIDDKFNGRAAFAQIDIPDSVDRKVARFTTPTSTGSQSYTLGIEPIALIIVATTTASIDARDQTATSEGVSIAVVDSAATYCTAISSKDGAATSDAYSRADNSLVVLDGDGNVDLAGTVSLTGTGFSINWTTVQASARQFIVMAFGGPPPWVGAVIEFVGIPTTTSSGVVQFYDLSNGNGRDINAWEWDFGDGTTSNERDPVHQYNESGTYSVTLTITAADGGALTRQFVVGQFPDEATPNLPEVGDPIADSLTKEAYITVNLGGGDPPPPPPGGIDLIGPYIPEPLTPYSETRLYGDPAGEKYGQISIGLGPGLAIVEIDPEDTTTPIPGRTRAIVTTSNNRLTFLFADGTSKYVSLT